MSYLKILALVALLMMSNAALAKRFLIDVDTNRHMVKHLRLLQVMSSEDTVVVQIGENKQFSKSTICRYVEALKNTKARVKVEKMPRAVMQHARGC